jgi:glycerol-3-phosphate O-acyltransferase
VADQGSGRRVRRDAVAAIVGSDLFAARVAQIAAASGRSVDNVRADATRCLVEMSAAVGPRASWLWDRFGGWLSRAYLIDVDDTRLPQLRALGERHSLVFLPNHRSYLDPLALRRVLSRHGLPPNRILGGVNLAMWPISTVGKRAGLVFIRRSFRDDPVYPAMLRLYLGSLLEDKANLEWYFEGGRTRTGKLRPPRMGVLRYLLDAFLANASAAAGTDGNDPDVYLVPVSIVYDQQHEVEAISREEGGLTKDPESLKLLVSFARAQSRRRGRAYIRFGEPLSLRETIADAVHRAGMPATDPPDAAGQLVDPATVVPRVAFEIAHRINAATPITPSALVTFALLDVDGRAFTVPELRRLLAPILVYLHQRHLPLTTGVDLANPEHLLPELRTLVREKVIGQYTGGLEPVYWVTADHHHEAAFYRNTVTHWFVTRAICELAVIAVAEHDATDVNEATWQAALDLRDLLKYEFFFPRNREFAEQMRAEIDLARPGWESTDLHADELTTALKDTGLLLAHRVVGPFLEAYLVLADRLAARDPADPADRDELVTECLGVARQRWLQQQLHSPESISKDLMLGAFTLAGNRDLLGTGGDELVAARARFAAELGDAVRRAGMIRRSALATFSADLPAAARPAGGASTTGAGRPG